jgi:DNA-binding NtrC family response regulator
VSVRLPALRERREDIPLLVQAFLEEFNGKYDKHVRAVDDAALEALTAQPWPGNVRELRNTIERAIIVSDGELITLAHLPQSAGPRAAPAAPDGADVVTFRIGTSLEEAERVLILRTLAAAGNNKTQAAQTLGISLKTLHNKLHRYADSPEPAPAGEP